MLLLVLLVTFALLAVCLQTLKAHLITFLSSLEEQQMLELILNCNHSFCGWLQSIVVVILPTCTFFYTFRFGFPLLLRVKDAVLYLGDSCWRGMKLFFVQRLPQQHPC